MNIALEGVEGDEVGVGLVEVVCEGPCLPYRGECGLYFAGMGRPCRWVFISERLL